VVEQGGQEQIEGADPAAPGGLLEALEAQADEGRGPARGDRFGHQLGRPDRVGVLRRVAAIAVTVLEVQPQVLDRFPFELGVDARRDLGHQLVRQPQGRAQRRGAAVGGHQLPRRPAPEVRQLDGVAVGGYVDRVHRLTPTVLAGVGGGEEGVGLGQPLVESVQGRRGQPGRGPVRAHVEITTS
jgi:hypothetical protein